MAATNDPRDHASEGRQVARLVGGSLGCGCSLAVAVVGLVVLGVVVFGVGAVLSVFTGHWSFG